MRVLTCPFAAVEARVPREGDIVDFGCGFGAFARFLARRSPSRHVLAMDPDARKIAAAAALFADSPVQWRVQDDRGALPECDAIVMVDVLYLLTEPRQRALLAACHEALRPGGVLLVKGVGDRPAWKVAWYRLQDALASVLLRLHPDAKAHPVAPTVLAEWAREAGFHVEQVPLDRGYPYPHHLLVARR